jgi:hypothetical protein
MKHKRRSAGIALAPVLARTLSIVSAVASRAQEKQTPGNFAFAPGKIAAGFAQVAPPVCAVAICRRRISRVSNVSATLSRKDKPGIKKCGQKSVRLLAEFAKIL